MSGHLLQRRLHESDSCTLRIWTLFIQPTPISGALRNDANLLFANYANYANLVVRLSATNAYLPVSQVMTDDGRDAI